MYLVTIDAEECSGCGQCVSACPSQIISLVEAKAQVTGDTSECLGCESCVVICDRNAVAVQEY